MVRRTSVGRDNYTIPLTINHDAHRGVSDDQEWSTEMDPKSDSSWRHNCSKCFIINVEMRTREFQESKHLRIVKTMTNKYPHVDASADTGVQFPAFSTCCRWSVCSYNRTQKASQIRHVDPVDPNKQQEVVQKPCKQKVTTQVDVTNVMVESG